MVGEGATKTLSTVLLYVCQPAMAVSAFCVFSDADFEIVNSVPKLRLLRNFAVIAVLAVVGLFALYFVCRLIFRKAEDKKTANLYSYAGIFANCGFVGLPFIQMFTDGNPLATMYMMAFMVAFNFVNWTLGVYLISGDKKQISLKKVLLNPAILFSFFAMILLFFPKINFFRFDGLEMLGTVPQYINYSTSPIGMMIIGIRLAEMTPKQLFCRKGVYLSAFIRLIVSPFLMLLITLPIQHLFGQGLANNYEEYFYLAPIIAMSLSPASSVVAMAEKFGGDQEAGTAAFITTTFLSVITIPLVICAVMAICGIAI
jgi:hypothetical protein